MRLTWTRALLLAMALPAQAQSLDCELLQQQACPCLGPACTLLPSAPVPLGPAVLQPAAAAIVTPAAAAQNPNMPWLSLRPGWPTLPLRPEPLIVDAVTVQPAMGLAVHTTLTASSVEVPVSAGLSGTGRINAPTTIRGLLVPSASPGTLTFTASLTMHPGAILGLEIDGTGTANGGGNYSRVIVRGAPFTAAGGVVVPMLRDLTWGGIGDGSRPSNTYTPPLGQRFAGVVTADGGIQGGFEAMIQPAGLATGTRFDTIYAARTIDLVVTPESYANLRAAGLAQSASQAALGAALDAVRPAAGTLPTGATRTVFDAIYAMPPGALGAAFDQLSPMVYADALMASRLAWGATQGSITRRLDGLHPDDAAMVWADALGAYGSVRAGAGSPGASTGLGGLTLGYDTPLGARWRIGAAVSAIGGRVWDQAGGRAGLDGGQVALYARWRQGSWFADSLAAVLYQQANATRPMPSFAATARGSVPGAGVGGMLRGGYRVDAGDWTIEPSLALAGMTIATAGQTETGGGALSLHTQDQALGSLRSVLAVSARRELAFDDATTLALRADLGWAHEYAATRAQVQASFAGLPGSGFTQSSAPAGRDTALIGLSAELRGPALPLPLFIAWQGGLAAATMTQSLTAGVHMAW